MSVHARPEPKDAPQLAPTTHELLVTAQRTSHDLQGWLRRHVEALTIPAELRGPYRLNASTPSKRDDDGADCPSFSIINANPVTVYLGLGGTMPRPGQGAIAVPPNSLMTLPVAPGDLDLGVDANDSNLVGDAVVHVLRHATVQPAFLGAVNA